MPLPRPLLGLLTPLLALLLLAGAPAAGLSQAEGSDRIRLIEASVRIVALATERASEWSLEAQAEPQGDEDLDPPEPLLNAARFELPLDRARLIEIGRTCYPTAPPSHRPCAAPPTGPPLLV